MRLRRFCAALAVLSALTRAAPAHALQENIKVCGAYVKKDGATSHGYKLTMTRATGSEMNAMLKTSGFDPASVYVFVKWKKGGMSIFLEDPGRTLTPDFNIEHRDQRGKIWYLRAGWNNCH